VGTTVPIFIPKTLDQSDAGPVLPESGYFRVRIAAAQAAVFGSILQQTGPLVVMSDVTLNCPPFGNTQLRSIQRVRDVRNGAATQLGLAINLVDLTPAVMERLTLGVDFILDTKNRFAMLTGLANSDAFLSVVSLAPGAAAVAKQMAGLADKVVSTFTDFKRQQPLLRFIADYNLATGDLRDGYYVILGSPYEKHALSRPLPKAPSLQILEGDLLFDDKPITQWSYVVLDVDTVQIRGRSIGRGEPWHEKLQLADARAEAVANDPFALEATRRSAWESCEEMLREARILLHNSPLYLPSEVKSIIRTAYRDAHDRIFPSENTRLGAPPALSAAAAKFLAVNSFAELNDVAAEYGEAEARAEHKLRMLGVLD
jgi:hypothetical protein